MGTLYIGAVVKAWVSLEHLMMVERPARKHEEEMPKELALRELKQSHLQPKKFLFIRENRNESHSSLLDKLCTNTSFRNTLNVMM